MTPVGFKPTPFRNGALSHRLRPLGQSVIDAMFSVAFLISSWRAGVLCAKFSPSHLPTANTFCFQVWHNQAFLCGVHKERRSSKMSTPGVEPGLSRPQRDVLTTRRCGPCCKWCARATLDRKLFADPDCCHRGCCQRSWNEHSLKRKPAICLHFLWRRL